MPAEVPETPTPHRAPVPPAPRRTLAHPWIVATVALLGFVATTIVARRRPLPAVEVDVNRTFNDAPAWVAHGLWPVMQLGTLWGPLVVAVVIGWWRRDRLLAVCLVVAELATWTTVRSLKEAVDRGRPPAFLDDVVVRDGVARGLGFPSGHSATAAMTAVVCMAAVPRRHRWVLVVVAVAVGVARIVHGVHLPADVIGGWSYGVLVGVATLAVYDRIRARRVERPG